MFARISRSSVSTSELCVPWVYGGWCQNATIHWAVVAERSLCSQVAIGPEAERLTWYEFNEMKCVLP